MQSLSYNSTKAPLDLTISPCQFRTTPTDVLRDNVRPNGNDVPVNEPLDFTKFIFQEQRPKSVKPLGSDESIIEWTLLYPNRVRVQNQPILQADKTYLQNN